MYKFYKGTFTGFVFVCVDAHINKQVLIHMTDPWDLSL